MYSFPNLESVCSMSGSNCCLLTCIQISQEAAKVVWYSHLLKNFPQFLAIHTVKGIRMTQMCSFLWFSSIPLYIYTTASLSIHLYPGCFHVLAIVNLAATNDGIHVSFSVLVSSGYMPRCGIAGSYGSFILSF